MTFLYNLSIFFLGLGIRIASLFHPKAKAFVTGRRGLLKKLDDVFRQNHTPVVWVHCASLGEFEQARPLIEAVKKEWPSYKVLLTFFSPSGYEIRKNFKLADHVT